MILRARQRTFEARLSLPATSQGSSWSYRFEILLPWHEDAQEHVVIAIDQRWQICIVGFVDCSRRDEDAKLSKAHHDILGLDHESHLAPPRQLFCNNPMASH